MKTLLQTAAKQLLPAGLRRVLRNGRGWPWVLALRMRRDTGAKPLHQIRFARRHDQAVVLGNGPSLTADLPALARAAGNYDFVCVNGFSTSEHYTVLKPRYCVFLDAYFFARDAHPSRVAQREQAFAAIDRKTDWDLQIFLPWGADEQVLRQHIRNPRVSICRLAVRAIDPEVLDASCKRRLDSGRCGPATVNVLIYAVYLAIWAGFARIHVFGGDMSFHKDVEVDPRTNDLLIRYRYFNQPDSTELFLHNPARVKKWRMAEFMRATAKTFRAHEVLDWYAKQRGSEIVNCTDSSLIDAYRRCPVEERPGHGRAQMAAPEH